VRCWRQGLAAVTTEVKDIDDGPPRDAGARDLGAQRLQSPALGDGLDLENAHTNVNACINVQERYIKGAPTEIKDEHQPHSLPPSHTGILSRP
jgi:hypothetical protein